MINRALIRLKVIQLVYAYYQQEGKDLDTATKELDFSLQKAIDLFHYLLAVPIELKKIAIRKENIRAAQAKRAGTDAVEPSVHTILAENRLIEKLEANKQMIDFLEMRKQEWPEEAAFMKQLYEEVTATDYAADYAAQLHKDFDSDKEFVRKLYRFSVMGNDRFDSLIEDHSLYWNDDKDIVDTFVLKAIKQIEEHDGEEADLLPDLLKDEDRHFAHRLFSQAITRGPELRDMVAKVHPTWDMQRLVVMDIVILQTAVAEVLTFDDIPLNVTFNEYIEIAKVYGTPQSPSFVNGTLQQIVTELKKEGRTTKARQAAKPAK